MAGTTFGEVFDLVDELVAQETKNVREGKSSPVSLPMVGDPDMPDISQIDTDNIVINESSKISKVNKVEEDNKVENIEDLVTKFDNNIREGREILTKLLEMTTVGSIGVNTAGGSKKKKNKTNKNSICATSVGSVGTKKFERCVRRVAKGYGADK